MQSTVGIVGAGISGLTLALRLQQLGVPTAVYSDLDADGIRLGRLQNTVARFAPALARDQELGLSAWPSAEFDMRAIHFAAGSPLELKFVAMPTQPFAAIDFRLLLPAMMVAYQERGGDFHHLPEAPSVESIDEWSCRHELMVVAVGRRSLSRLFPVDRGLSPYDRPQRRLFAGVFDGLDLPSPRGLSFNLAPGAGEIFQMPLWTEQGLATNLLIEAIQGGPLERVTLLDPESHDFAPELERALKAHAPAIWERVRPSGLGLRGPLDWVAGSVTPAVRQFDAKLPSGRMVIAIGDAWITNDPVTGQGANLASYTAWRTADAIVKARALDESFARELRRELWEYAGPVTACTNAFLAPPPPHVLSLMAAAARDDGVARAVADGFARPAEFATALSGADRTARFIEQAAVAA